MFLYITSDGRPLHALPVKPRSTKSGKPPKVIKAPVKFALSKDGAGTERSRVSDAFAAPYIGDACRSRYRAGAIGVRHRTDAGAALFVARKRCRSRNRQRANGA